MKKLAQNIWRQKFIWQLCLTIISLALGIMSYYASQHILFSIHALSVDDTFNLVEKSFTSKNAFHETQIFLTILSLILLLITVCYLVSICLGKKTPEQKSQKSLSLIRKKLSASRTSFTFYDFFAMLRHLLLLIVIITGWELALLCSEVSTFTHQIFQKFSVQVLNFSPVILDMHYTALLWCSIGFLLMPILAIGIIVHINNLDDRQTRINIGDEDEGPAISVWWKANYGICLVLLILWITSPIFLGENSLNYRYVWTWDKSFSLWICVGIVLTFVIAVALMCSQRENMILIWGFIIGLIIVSWLKAIICGLHWHNGNTLVGASSSILLLLALSVNCWSANL